MCPSDCMCQTQGVGPQTSFCFLSFWFPIKPVSRRVSSKKPIASSKTQTQNSQAFLEPFSKKKKKRRRGPGTCSLRSRDPTGGSGVSSCTSILGFRTPLSSARESPWTKSVSHHLSPRMSRFPCQCQQRNGFPWFQSGAGFRPSTVG